MRSIRARCKTFAWPCGGLILVAITCIVGQATGQPTGTDVNLGGFAEPTIAVNPNDPLNIAYASLNELRVSTDGGATFGPSIFQVVPETHLLAADPSLAFDSEGRLFWTYLGWVTSPGTFDFYGTDIFIAQCDPQTGAILPGYPVNVSAPAGHPAVTGNQNDKEWLAVDSHAESPFRDRIYVAWIRFQQPGNKTRVHITHSTDQGLTWTTRLRLDESETPERYKWPVHLAAAPSGDVYVAYHSEQANGNEGRIHILRSTDGGVSFPQKTLAYEPDEAGMIQNRGLITVPGAKFSLLGSRQPWVLADPLIPGRVYVVANDDPDNDFFAGDAANVYIKTSTDYGVTWTGPDRIDTGPGDTFQVMPTAAIEALTGHIAVHYYDNRRGLVNGGGNYLLDVWTTVSRDHGVSFSSESRINDAAFDPDQGGHCMYQCGPYLNSVWGLSGNEVYAVGSRGTILRYNGTSWTADSSGTTQDLYGIWGSSSDNIMTVGTGGTLLRWDGSAWSSETSGTTESLAAVWGSAADDIIAVGNNGTIVRYDGSTWSPDASPTTERLTSLWGTAANNVIAVGSGGTILRYDGTAWSLESAGTTEWFEEVWGSASDNVLVGSYRGNLYRFDGTAWSLDQRLAHKVYTLWGSSATDVFAIGTYSCHFDGTDWSVFGQIAGFGGGGGIWGTGPDNVYAVGNDARILHYDGTSWSVDDSPARSPNAISHIGEYNGIALADAGSARWGYAVWCGNRAVGPEILGRQSVFHGFDANAVTAPEIVSLAADAPSTIHLGSCSPNPTSGRTAFSYAIPTTGVAQLALYDVTGRRVVTLLNAAQKTGRYHVTWDARTNSGDGLASGVYFLRLESNGETAVERLVIRR